MKVLLAASVLTAMSASQAWGQSSVTLYGVVDMGVDYASNVASSPDGTLVPGSGGTLVQMKSGVAQTSSMRRGLGRMPRLLGLIRLVRRINLCRVRGSRICFELAN